MFRKHWPAFALQLRGCGLVLLFTLLIAGLPRTGWSQAKEPSQPPANLDELKTQIEKILHDTKTPGAGIALVRKDGIEWVGGFGLADVAAKKPATEDTLFRIGSVTKMFVALSVLKLQEEGKLNLQDTLKSRAPDLEFSNPWETTEPLRLIHLLEHTGAWPDLSWSECAYKAEPEPPLKKGLEFHPQTRISRWKPGLCRSYTNEGPPAVAYVVEKVTNQRFEDYVRHTWFEPLRMPTADFFETPAVKNGLAKQYHNDGKTTYPYWRLILRPAGSLNVSAREMANFMRFFVDRGQFDGVQLLPAEAIDRMERCTTTLAAREGWAAGYGLCNFVSQKGGRAWHGHGGGVSGSLTDFFYQKEAGVGYVCMINSSNSNALTQLSEVITAYLTRAMPPPFLPPVASVSDPKVRDYDGWYEPFNLKTETSRYQDRILGLVRIRTGSTALDMATLFKGTQTFVPVNDRHYRRAKDPLGCLALIADRSEGTLLQYDVTLYRRIPTWVAWMELTVPALALILAISSVVFATVWIPRKLLGRLRTVKHLSVRVLPLLAIASIVTTQLVYMNLGGDWINRLAQVSFWSLTIMLSTIAYAVFSVLGLVQAVRHHRSEIRRLVWWHSFIVSLFLTIVAAYLSYWGFIGYRSWV